MNVKLFVGNLPYSATDEQLQQLFAQAGTVISAVVITDRMSGRSKGFGFVEFGTEEEAQKAIEMFNEYELDGRKLNVNKALPKQPREFGGNRGGNGGGFRPRRDDFRGGNRGGFRGGRNDR